MRKRININDVAKAAGVHRSTVSRALTGSGPVSPANKEKVLVAAKALNYHPDTLAGALKSKRRNTWGLLSFWAQAAYATDWFYAKSLGGLLDSANKLNYRLLLQNTVGRFDQSDEAVRFCHDAQLAGLVVLAPRTLEKGLEELKRVDVPVVLLSHTPSERGYNYVDLDNAAGARLAVEHFVAKGHKRIAFIGAEGSLSSNARDRLRGYREGLAQAGLSADPQLEQISAFFDPAFGATALTALRNLPPSKRPTALFCSTDLMARRAMDEAARSGMSVPQDLAVIGFDNNPDSNGNPGLTTVHYPFFEAGALAGELLSRLGNGEAGPLSHVIQPKLVMRDSA
jgi:LacI family transcriptional regulator